MTTSEASNHPNTLRHKRQDVEWRIVPASRARNHRSSEICRGRLVEPKEGFLMRRLLVALCALLALALAGPLMVSAQDATPEAGTGATDVERTDIRYLLPFGPDCMNADNQIFDPCFEPLMMDPDELGQLACVEDPFSTEVTLLTLTEPLVREKEAADPGSDPSMGMGQEADDVIAPWDLPWALELANGDRCTLLHGTLTVMAGQIVYYGCVNGGMVLGETDHTQPVWTVSYLAEGEFASRLVDVAVAWS